MWFILTIYLQDGESPLHLAVIRQPMDIIEKLIDKGMDPNIQGKVSILIFFYNLCLQLKKKMDNMQGKVSTVFSSFDSKSTN